MRSSQEVRVEPEVQVLRLDRRVGPGFYILAILLSVEDEKGRKVGPSEQEQGAAHSTHATLVLP
jgi:hypothetical protein